MSQETSFDRGGQTFTVDLRYGFAESITGRVGLSAVGRELEKGAPVSEHAQPRWRGAAITKFHRVAFRLQKVSQESGSGHSRSEQSWLGGA